MVAVSDKLTQVQLELLKSFRFVSDEKQLKEVKSLLNYYFRQKLDTAIDSEEATRNYTATIYNQWLNSTEK